MPEQLIVTGCLLMTSDIKGAAVCSTSDIKGDAIEA